MNQSIRSAQGIYVVSIPMPDVVKFTLFHIGSHVVDITTSIRRVDKDAIRMIAEHVPCWNLNDAVHCTWDCDDSYHKFDGTAKSKYDDCLSENSRKMVKQKSSQRMVLDTWLAGWNSSCRWLLQQTESRWAAITSAQQACDVHKMQLTQSQRAANG